MVTSLETGPKFKWARGEVTAALYQTGSHGGDNGTWDTVLINLLLFGHSCEEKRELHRDVGSLRKDAAIRQVLWDTDSECLRFGCMRLIGECFQGRYLWASEGRWRGGDIALWCSCNRGLSWSCRKFWNGDNPFLLSHLRQGAGTFIPPHQPVIGCRLSPGRGWWDATFGWRNNFGAMSSQCFQQLVEWVPLSWRETWATNHTAHYRCPCQSGGGRVREDFSEDMILDSSERNPWYFTQSCDFDHEREGVSTRPKLWYKTALFTLIC